MYVCICNAVTEKQVHQAIDRGAISVDDLSRLLAVGNQCGSCRDCARQCLREWAEPLQPGFPLASAA